MHTFLHTECAPACKKRGVHAPYVLLTNCIPESNTNRAVTQSCWPVFEHGCGFSHPGFRYPLLDRRCSGCFRVCLCLKQGLTTLFLCFCISDHNFVCTCRDDFRADGIQTAAVLRNKTLVSGQFLCFIEKKWIFLW